MSVIHRIVHTVDGVAIEAPRGRTLIPMRQDILRCGDRRIRDRL